MAMAVAENQAARSTRLKCCPLFDVPPGMRRWTWSHHVSKAFAIHMAAAHWPGSGLRRVVMKRPTSSRNSCGPFSAPTTGTIARDSATRPQWQHCLKQTSNRPTPALPLPLPLPLPLLQPRLPLPLLPRPLPRLLPRPSDILTKKTKHKFVFCVELLFKFQCFVQATARRCSLFGEKLGNRLVRNSEPVCVFRPLKTNNFNNTKKLCFRHRWCSNFAEIITL